MIRKVLTITGTTPAAASTAIVGSQLNGLHQYTWFTLDAALVGATGGVLDIYIQRQIALAEDVAGGIWVDWLHFTQLAAGAAAIKYSVESGSGTSIATVAHSTDASAGTPILAAGTFVGGHPGQAIRCVAVAGASTSAGAAVTIYLNCFADRR